MRHRRWVCCVGAVVACAWPSIGAAHLDLISPIPREQGRFNILEITNTNLKEGPCGQRVNGRTDKQNVFAPGQTIAVVWDEFIDHSSYYRVAFDRDGDDDFPTFSGPGIDSLGDDAREFCPVDGEVILAYEMNDRRGGRYTLDVTLPEVECDNCTLQVVQYMYGRGRQRPYYFQCADIVLRQPSVVRDAGAGDASVLGDGGLASGTADAGADASTADGGVQAPPVVRAAASCSEQLASSPLPEPAAQLPPESSDGELAEPAPPGDDSTGAQPSAPLPGPSTEGSEMSTNSFRSEENCACRLGQRQSPNHLLASWGGIMMAFAAGLLRRRRMIVKPS